MQTKCTPTRQTYSRSQYILKLSPTLVLFQSLARNSIFMLLSGDFIGLERKHTWKFHNNWVQDKWRIVQSAFKQSQAHGGHRQKSQMRSSKNVSHRCTSAGEAAAFLGASIWNANNAMAKIPRTYLEHLGTFLRQPCFIFNILNYSCIFATCQIPGEVRQQSAKTASPRPARCQLIWRGRSPENGSSPAEDCRTH